MASSQSTTPDLASILATLSALAPQGPPSNPQNPQNVLNAQPSRDSRDYANPHQQSQWQQQQQQQQAHQFQSTGTGHTAHNVTPSYGRKVEVQKAEQKIVDPATITDWSSGLRCVMKIVTQNENIVREIKKMIQVQHEHERQWWESRQALITKQAERQVGQKKLDDVLRAIGGATQGKPLHDAETDASELRVFDTKIWNAQRQMFAEFEIRLKRLGIPFFGTKSEYVKKEVDGEGGEGKDGGKGTVGKKELEGLQKRMIGILEDLCRD